MVAREKWDDCDIKDDYGMKFTFSPLRWATAGCVPDDLSPLRLTGVLLNASKGQGNEPVERLYMIQRQPQWGFHDPREADGTRVNPYVMMAEGSFVVVGWVRFDSPVDEPGSFRCRPLYFADSGIPCLVLRERQGDVGVVFERMGLAVICSNDNSNEEKMWEVVHAWLLASERAGFILG